MTGVFDDIYADGYFGNLGFSVNLPVMKLLGTSYYTASPDKKSFQNCVESYPLHSDEYDECIDDLAKFSLNVVSRRRFPALNRSREEVKKILIQCVKEMDNWAAQRALAAKIVKDEYAMYSIGGGFFGCPFDKIFDNLRGFKDTLVDIRKRPEKVIELTNAIMPGALWPLKNIQSAYPFFINFAHAPAYLGVKNFEKFYWPTYKKLITAITEAGSKAVIHCQGRWEPEYYALLEDAVGDSGLILLIENNDPVQISKIMGRKATIMSGVCVKDLKYKNKEEVFDLARKIIDELAPGGGFLFSTDRSLLTVDDVNTENYIALQEFVHEYGKY